MEDTISQAKVEFIRAKERLAGALATTPDDKTHWSPSPTARTPLQQVGHAAQATPILMGLLTGKPLPFAGLPEADAMRELETGFTGMRETEKGFMSRRQVLDLLDQTSAEYLAWLDTLTPEQVGSTVSMPFGLMPMAAGITLAADHLRSHAAQIDYTQTIYGDLDWHVPS